MKKTLLAAAMALLTTAGYAQFVSQTPAGGFDLNSGKDYIPVYMPAPQLSQIQGKILADNNLDPDQVNNSLDFWIDDWNGKNASKVQAYVVPEGTVEKNSWGGTEYIGITPIGYYCCPLKLKGSSPPYPQCRQTGIADSFFEK